MPPTSFPGPPPAVGTPGTIPGQTVLDQAPPSPAMQTGMSTGVPLGNLVPPMDSNQLPPEVLTGMLQGCAAIEKMLLSFASMTPDLAPAWANVKEALLQAMAQVVQSGGGPVSPVATGPQYPGGGLDSGGGPPALS